MMTKFLEFTTFDYPGGYLDQIQALPDSVEALGKLVRLSTIHRTTLDAGNVGTNSDLRFGDMRNISQFRQPDDDYLVTAAAMLAELYRLDSRGLVADREVANKIVVTCRFVAILMSSILKAKGIPVRICSGFAGYFDGGKDNKVWDHWVNEYWNGERWILIDVDGSFSMDKSVLNPYDLPYEQSFIFGHQAWLNLRKKNDDPIKYQNAGGYHGLLPAAWALVHDFHAVMGHPITYLQTAKIVTLALGEPWGNQEINEDKAKEIDKLAYAMGNIENNWEQLLIFWQNPEFRLVRGGLI
jgi:hypothetical protein